MAPSGGDVMTPTDGSGAAVTCELTVATLPFLLLQSAATVMAVAVVVALQLAEISHYIIAYGTFHFH